MIKCLEALCWTLWEAEQTGTTDRSFNFAMDANLKQPSNKEKQIKL